MAYQIKLKIAKSLYEALHNNVNPGHFNDFFRGFSLIQDKKDQIIWKLRLPLEHKTSLNLDLFRKSQQELLGKETVKGVTLDSEKNSVQVEVNVRHFIKDIVDSDPTKLNCQASPQKILCEFSSPNIAKPFHVGHLRSTILGNSLSNIKKKLGNDVVKLNYLGDWGTQFGMIQLGMQLENYCEEDLKKNPLEVLYKAYVKGNAEAELNENYYNTAKRLFMDLEFGEEKITQKWNEYRKWTIESLNAVYNRLGVSFDEFNWESEYKRENANNILKVLEDQGILFVDKQNRKVAVVDNKEYVLLKSDGTTLYLLRDLMAVVDRRSKYKFNEMYYVVENGQSEHFSSLKALCAKLNLDKNVIIKHVKFGRIHGMSTRKGKVIFLSDILDEAQERVYEIQKKSRNTKVSLETRETAETLGISAVIINDLKQKRIKNYEFSWEKILQIKGNTGVALQYTHCRLHNLEVESGHSAALECDPDALLEPQAVDLVKAIAKYEEVLWYSNTRLEPCVLVKFLFDLNKTINVAYKFLNVKYGDKHVSSQRLLLFNRAKQVLNEGLKLLGLKPVNKM